MIDMDEAELLHLAMADYMLNAPAPTPPPWRVVSLGEWRRKMMAGDWNETRLPLYLWIAVKPR